MGGSDSGSTLRERAAWERAELAWAGRYFAVTLLEAGKDTEGTVALVYLSLDNPSTGLL